MAVEGQMKDGRAADENRTTFFIKQIFRFITLIEKVSLIYNRIFSLKLSVNNFMRIFRSVISKFFFFFFGAVVKQKLYLYQKQKRI